MTRVHIMRPAKARQEGMEESRRDEAIVYERGSKRQKKKEGGGEDEGVEG